MHCFFIENIYFDFASNDVRVMRLPREDCGSGSGKIAFFEGHVMPKHSMPLPRMCLIKKS